MRDIEIKISKESRKTWFSKCVIGNDSENLQGNLKFTFPNDYDPDKKGIENEFVDGQARLEYSIDGEKYYIPNLTKQDESYIVPIKSILTKEGQIYMQLVITEGTDPEEIPIFKSNVFFMTVNESINAEIEQPDEYQTWVEIFETYINKIEDTLNDLEDKVESGYFNGKDATINGVNTLELIAGDNIIIEQIGNQLKISAIGVSPLPDNRLVLSN
jgi:hypothetical protein